MANEPLPVPARPAFRLPKDPRVIAPPTPYEQLCAAYAQDVAREPRLPEWTQAALEERLRAEPELAHQQGRVHRNRARLLLVFLTKPVWPTPELQQTCGLSETMLQDARRALRDFGLLAIRVGGRGGNKTCLTPFGEMWLVDLVEPGSLVVA